MKSKEKREETKERKAKTMKNKQKGITLIALVITIIVLLILAGISIASLTGENGILTRASEAKEVTELANLKEEVQLEVLAMEMNQKPINTTEVMEQLMEKNIIDKDRHFVKNSSYSLRYCGDIVYDDEVVDSVDLTRNSSNLVVRVSNLHDSLTGNRTIICKDGIVERIDNESFLETGYTLKANQEEDGKKFGYWVDEYDNIVAYEEKVGFTATISDRRYIPIYVNEDEIIEKKNTINIYGTNETIGDYLVFHAVAVIDKPEVTSFHCGTLGTKNENLANTKDLIYKTTNSEIYDRGDDKNEQLDTYIVQWTKSNVGTETWYCRGVLEVTYSDGTKETLYSDIISKRK